MNRPIRFGGYAGEDVDEIVLRAEGGAEMRVITFGAVIRDLKIPSPQGPRRVLLGFETLDSYIENAYWHFGAVPGRVANRIGCGRFSLDGETWELPKNQDARHTLHGGEQGFGTRNWAVAACDERSVTLALVSEDGDQGFPGRLVTTVTYRLLPPAVLRISYTATTDRATPINLTNHAYFNLDGEGDVLSHALELEADFFTPTDRDLIPSGEIRPVAGTPWDFRAGRSLRYETVGGLFHYDGNVVLRSRTGLAKAARVTSSRRDMTMEVWTTKPGLQVFDAATLKIAAPGLGGSRLLPRSGFCLEPQFFPDSVNKAHFPDCILRPGAAYAHTTEYRFLS